MTKTAPLRELGPDRLCDLHVGGEASTWAVSSECNGTRGGVMAVSGAFRLALEMVCFPSSFSFKPHHCHRPREKPSLPSRGVALHSAGQRAPQDPRVFPFGGQPAATGAREGICRVSESLASPPDCQCHDGHCLTVCLCLVARIRHLVGTVNIC